MCVCVCVCVCMVVCVSLSRLKELRMEMELIEEQLANQTAKQDVIQDEILGVHKKCVCSELSLLLPCFSSCPYFLPLLSLFSSSLSPFSLPPCMRVYTHLTSHGDSTSDTTTAKTRGGVWRWSRQPRARSRTTAPRSGSS